MDSIERKWLRIAVINLSIVALAGLILRYKISFSLPFIDQKNLLHGHSHFAFSGWLTMALMTLMVGYLYRNGITNAFIKYKWLLIVNLVTAYGMLISFVLQGYALFSISCSTLSIVVSYIFAVKFWKDSNRLAITSISHSWFKCALLFNLLSSVGAFGLAFMMAMNIAHQTWYLSAVYFFLHFQYNGWFFFVCMGLFMQTCEKIGIEPKLTRTIFLLFATSCVPAYYLSALWMPMYPIVFVAVVLSAIAQVAGMYLFLRLMYRNRKALHAGLLYPVRIIFSLSCLALLVKLLLQLGSTYPALSQLAFGFRPIVIAYLHLVLLGVITVFLLGHLLYKGNIFTNRFSIIGISIFISGIIVNELFLMIQGVSGIWYVSVPYINEFLLMAAIILLSGAIITVLSMFVFQHNTEKSL